MFRLTQIQRYRLGYFLQIQNSKVAVLLQLVILCEQELTDLLKLLHLPSYELLFFFQFRVLITVGLDQLHNLFREDVYLVVRGRVTVVIPHALVCLGQLVD